MLLYDTKEKKTYVDAHRISLSEIIRRHQNFRTWKKCYPVTTIKIRTYQIVVNEVGQKIYKGTFEVLVRRLEYATRILYNFLTYFMRLQDRELYNYTCSMQ